MVLLCQVVVLLGCIFVILASLMSVQKGRASKLFCHCVLINEKNALPLHNVKVVRTLTALVANAKTSFAFHSLVQSLQNKTQECVFGSRFF